MTQRIFNVTLYFDKYSTTTGTKTERHSAFSPAGSDDTVARNKAIKLFQKAYMKEYGIKAPQIKFCEIEYLATVDG